MRQLDKATPIVGAIGARGQNIEENNAQHSEHGTVANATVMLNFVKRASSKFHRDYFSRMAAKFDEIEQRRAESLRRQTLGDLCEVGS